MTNATQKLANVWVFLWNTKIDDLRDVNGGLPWFRPSIWASPSSMLQEDPRESAKEDAFGTELCYENLPTQTSSVRCKWLEAMRFMTMRKP